MRISGGAESVADLVRRELGEQLPDPLRIGTRDVLSDPVQPQVHDQCYWIKNEEQCRTRGRLEVNILVCDLGDELRMTVRVQIASRAGAGPAPTCGAEAR